MRRSAAREPIEYRRLAAAAALFVALAGATLLAGIARVAQTPAAGAQGGLGRIAPGALGMIRFGLAQVGTQQFEVDPGTARQALRGMPLASDPLTALAAEGLIRNPKGTDKETALLQEALRRDPRSRTARILLLRQVAASGDLAGAFNQLAAFSRLNPGLVATIMEAITVRITTPQQVDEALAAIDDHAVLYRPFVMRMSGKRKNPDVILRLTERLPANVMADPEVRASMVGQLVQAGEYAVARNLWQKGNPAGASGLLHSPDFADTKAQPPFNWKLTVDSTGAAERLRGGGVSIAYYDRNPGPLAEQLLTLNPGAYRVVSDFERIGGTADNVRLQIRCHGSGAVLGEAAFVSRKPGLNRLSMNFAVPAFGCPGQVLAIAGVASEDRGETQLQVQRVELTAIRGTQ